MRFHMGISFRFKTLKKFLFPFLIGLLTYFGISSFNIMQVHAYNSTTTFYRFQYDEIDFDDIQTNGDYSFKDILDITQIPSEYYYVDSYIQRTYNPSLNVDSYNVVINLFPKSSFNSFNISIYGKLYNGNYYLAYESPTNFSHVVLWNNTLNQNLSQQQFELLYSKFYSCLTENVCDSNYFTTTTDRVSLRIDNFGTISNTESYTINFKNYLFDSTQNERFIPYYTNMDSVLRTIPSTTTSSQFYKKTSINGVGVSAGEYLNHYCDFYSCESSNNVGDFVSYLEKLPMFFTNTTDLSTYSFDFSYNVSAFIDTTDYLDNLYTYMFYYGRVNHNGYYTYEELNCSRSATGTIDNHTITENVSNISCTNDLTRYDKFFITYYNTYTDNGNWLNAIYNLSYHVDSNSNIVYSLNKSGNLYDNFDNLSRGFKVLLSNKHETLGGYVFVDSSNDYVAFDFISNVSDNMDLTTNGDWYKNIPEPKKFDFGYDIGKNLLIYDDISYSTDNSTNLGLYLTGNTMVSFPVSDSYYYYDSTGTITQSTIILTYDTIDKTNNYDLSGIFNQINSFIDSINNDLFSFHTILDSIYNSIPTFIQAFIFIIYTLFLVYLLFRFIRK